MVDDQYIFCISEEARSFVSSTRRMFIDGEFVDAADGATVGVLNPATGAELTTLPRASRTDVGRAVEAATRAFEEGVWVAPEP